MSLDGTVFGTFSKVTKSYDSQNGILTLRGGVVSCGISGKNSSSSNLTIHTYLIR